MEIFIGVTLATLYVIGATATVTWYWDDRMLTIANRAGSQDLYPLAVIGCGLGWPLVVIIRSTVTLTSMAKRRFEAVK